MKKLFTILLLACAGLFVGCSQETAPADDAATAVEETATDAAAATDEHAGHDHGDHEGHDH